METGIKTDLQKSVTKNYVQEYIVENTDVISLPEELLEYQKKIYSLIIGRMQNTMAWKWKNS